MTHDSRWWKGHTLIFSTLLLISLFLSTSATTNTHTRDHTQLDLGQDALNELMNLELQEGPESSGAAAVVASVGKSGSGATGVAIGSGSGSGSVGMSASTAAALPGGSVGGSKSGSVGLPDLSQLLPPLPAGEASMGEVLPPYTIANGDATVSPPLGTASGTTLALDLDRRIQQTQNLLDRMVFQLNRETAWANSVHDIIQNYQYKYTKVLQDIKAHTGASAKMRELVGSLKRARLHEVLQNDLQKATQELNELAATSSETSEDEGSYSSLKDRVSLMKQDLEKMSNVKINKVLHRVQQGLKDAAAAAVPSESADTLKGLVTPPKK